MPFIMFCVFLYSFRQWLKSEDIQRISLLFYNKTLEKEYRTTTLPAFKYYVTCACLIFFCIFIVQILVLPKTSILGISFGVAFLLLSFILFICFAGQLLQCSNKASASLLWILKSSGIIANRPWPRITITLTTTTITLTMAIFNMVSIMMFCFSFCASEVYFYFYHLLG
ncbi:adenylate cyclase type 2-like [Chrysemys picta bellii]|uniref:adenylate cyclase type 2-like n=1 Tax=Chrysemys picta bellii TaxID=8478 RepID=UPI0032B24E5E